MNDSATRRRIAVWIAFTIAALSAASRAAEPPNIILCMGDDHGWDETTYNGHPHVRTPVLDEMAASGLRLDRFYSAAPVCSPTRGSVLTGRHPNRYGTFSPNWSMRPEEITIAQILRKTGYACGQFGKWHLGAVKAGSPLNPKAMGFDEYLSHDNFFEMDPYLSRNGGPPEKFEGESSQILVDEAIRFIGRAREEKRPVFVVIWFGSPHEPYVGLEKDLALYDKLPELYGDRSVTLTSLETGRSTKRPLGDVLRERYAEITAMDRAMGNLRRYLDEAGLRKKTLLWYCGDNGIPASGGRLATPFRGQKGAVYDGGIRVPAVIEWPERIPEPRATDVNTVTSDILPTICALVGQPVPDRPIDGISLKPLIDGEMRERPEPICFWSFNAGREKSNKSYIDPKLQEGTTPLAKEMDGRFTRNFVNYHHPVITEADFTGARAILDGRYKLVIHERKEKEPLKELFDLRADEAEANNLIGKKPDIAGKLDRQLRDWQQSVLESLTGADYRTDGIGPASVAAKDPPAAAGTKDWPQFLGPARNGISAATDLLDSWPADGPREVWRVRGGVGMSGLAIRDDLLVTMLQRDGKQLVVALDAKSGDDVWSAPVFRAYENDMGDGPRATPTITGDLIYAFTGEGVLAALDVKDGSLRWRREVLEELKGKPADYGMACSPLVVSNLVIVTAGAREATVVAYDRHSGEPSWKAGSDSSGYSSPALLEVGGRSQVVVFTGSSVLGIAPTSGEVLWRYPYETDFNCNIATPLEYKGNVFISSGENHGSALLAIEPAGDAFRVKEVWTSFGPRSVLRNEWQTSILLGGHLYGFDNVGSAGAVSHFNCVEIATGKRVWQQLRFGKGNLIAADGKLFMTSFKGELIVARASPEGYEEIGRKKVLGQTRQAPALAGGLLYLRDGREIVCLDVRKK